MGYNKTGQAMIFHPQTKIFIHDLVITASNVSEMLDHWKSKEDWVVDTREFIRQITDASETIQIQTSGTTGTPKIMTVLKSKMEHSALATGTYFNLQPGDTALLPLPVTYIAGKMMLVRALTLGLSLHIVKPASNPLLENNFQEPYNFATFVPLQMTSMLETEQSRQNLCCIGQIIIGGSGTDHQLLEQIQKMPNPVFETFGMTETLSHVALRRMNPPGHSNQPFKALPRVRFTADNRDCLVIEAPGILDAPLVTNDVVDLLDETSFFWQGRADNVINTGGVKVFPEVIEKQLSPFIRGDFFIASQPDPVLGQKVILVVEFQDPNNFPSGWLMKQMQDLIPRFSLPKAIYCVPRLLRNDHGKVKRKDTVAHILSHHIKSV